MLGYISHKGAISSFLSKFKNHPQKIFLLNLLKYVRNTKSPYLYNYYKNRLIKQFQRQKYPKYFLKKLHGITHNQRLTALHKTKMKPHGEIIATLYNICQVAPLIEFSKDDGVTPTKTYTYTTYYSILHLLPSKQEDP